MWILLPALMSAAAEQPTANGGVVEVVPFARDYNAPNRPAAWWRYLLPHAEAAGINLAMHLTTRYVLDLDWAYISPETIRKNGEVGWTWDQNEFTVNQLGHPYQGAMYYNAGRINDLTYWEAIPVLAIGSWEWERYLENEYPSINDQITTTWGGLFFGEMLYRLSSEVLDDSAHGGPRVWREIAAGLIDPMRGADRLVTGKAWRMGPPHISVPMRHELTFGYDTIRPWEGYGVARHRFHYHLNYGTAFARTRIRRPFDVFDFRLDLMLEDFQTRPGVLMMVTGGLWGRRFRALGSESNFFGFFQNYDYIETSVFNVGGSAVGPGWWGHYNLGPRWTLSAKWAWMLTVMGALDSPYAGLVTERDYVMGPGATSHFSLEFEYAPVGLIYAETRRYWVASLVEPVGSEFLGYQQWGLAINVWHGWGFGAGAAWADREGAYPDYETFTDHFLEMQVHLRKSL